MDRLQRLVSDGLHRPASHPVLRRHGEIERMTELIDELAAAVAHMPEQELTAAQASRLQIIYVELTRRLFG